jgi:hypothetical protein
MRKREAISPFTPGPDQLAPGASALTPMPPRELIINARCWPGGELEGPLERALAGVTILARKLRIQDIAEQIDKEIASAKHTAHVESMEFHAQNANQKAEENAPALHSEIKKILKDESNIFVDNSLKTWKEIEKMTCGRPDHDFTLDWFAKCIQEGKKYMVFGDHEKEALRAEIWNEDTGYFFPCEKCYQEDLVRRYVARNVRIRKK